MTIAVRDDDPLTATRLADAVLITAVARDQCRVHRAIEELVGNLTLRIQALDHQIADLTAQGNGRQEQSIGRANLRAEQQEQLYYPRVLAGSASGLLTVLQRADLPMGPVAPRPVLSATLAAIVAVILVLLIRLRRDLLDTRVRSIATLPRSPPAASGHLPDPSGRVAACTLRGRQPPARQHRLLAGERPL